VQELNECNRHGFITSDLWSPNSHDLDPVNYIWGIIQQQVYETKVQEVNDLRQLLIDVWAAVEQSITDNAIALPVAPMFPCLHSSQKTTF